MKDKATSIDLALYNALRYEEATLKYSDDADKLWDINAAEKQTILKWMNNRMKDIKDRL
tara:strand:+ start:3813 stop:3989 length:177 start_codon:yes stop_codon:yes gene_type:complete